MRRLFSAERCNGARFRGNPPTFPGLDPHRTSAKSTRAATADPTTPATFAPWHASARNCGNCPCWPTAFATRGDIGADQRIDFRDAEPMHQFPIKTPEAVPSPNAIATSTRILRASRRRNSCALSSDPIETTWKIITIFIHASDDASFAHQVSNTKRSDQRRGRRERR